ncbi:MAG: hypothetical protein JWN56_2203 [Sphingobacteriales bacterium]|nr:hypothetical protein [Sphingobacteriales bacterium]
MIFKKALLWFFAIGISLPGFAQDITAAKFAKRISTSDAKKHLTILSSDEFEGRETGKPGAEKAANYIAEQFKRLGLQAPVNGSYFQNFPLVENVFEVKSFNINGKALNYAKDFYFSTIPNATTLKTDEIVYIGYGIDNETYNDLEGTDIAGKVVLLINKDEPIDKNKTEEATDWSTNSLKRINYIQNKNPALILAVNPDVNEAIENYKISFPGKGKLSIKKPNSLSSLTQIQTVPVAYISRAVAGLFLKNSAKTYEDLKASINESSEPKTQTVKVDFNADFGIYAKEVNSKNVLGFLPGTDLKDEILVLSAHYDHIGISETGTDKINNGADDDGSGTTAVIELARAFTKAKKKGKGPRRSILFMTVSGEEKGLLGSEWYSEHPVFPLSQTITDLNIDMIGRVDPDHTANPYYCYLIGSDKLSTDLHKISENANSIYTKLSIDYKFNDPNDPERIYYRSDHYNFAKHNIPIIFYFNGIHEDYHKPSDEVSKINFNLLVKRAQLVYYTGWDLANRNKRPVVDVKSDMPAKR